jgi:hypothetical protein
MTTDFPRDLARRIENSAVPLIPLIDVYWNGYWW